MRHKRESVCSVVVNRRPCIPLGTADRSGWFAHPHRRALCLSLTDIKEKALLLLQREEEIDFKRMLSKEPLLEGVQSMLSAAVLGQLLPHCCFPLSRTPPVVSAGSDRRVF